LPERYLLSNTPAEVVAHAEVALSARDTPVRVALVSSRHPDVAELCVVTGERPTHERAVCRGGDRPGLLAAITAAIVGQPSRGARRADQLAPAGRRPRPGRRSFLGARPRGRRRRGQARVAQLDAIFAR